MSTPELQCVEPSPRMKRLLRVPALACLALAALAGCEPGADGGAVGSTSEAIHDSDRGRCSTRPVDPTQHYSATTDAIFLAESDATGLGDVPYYTAGFVSVRESGSATPTERAGACVYFPVFRGSDARAAARTSDIGTVWFRQGRNVGSASLSATTGRYSVDLAQFDTFTNGTAIPVAFLGGADGPGGFASLVFPPHADHTTFHASFTNLDAATVSRTSDTVVTWDPPRGRNSDDLVVSLALYDFDFEGPNILCAVPACAGRMTIPAQLTSHFYDGESLAAEIKFSRATRFVRRPGAAPISYVLGSVAEFNPTAH